MFHPWIFLSWKRVVLPIERETVDVIDDDYRNLDFHDYDVKQDDSCGADF